MFENALSNLQNSGKMPEICFDIIVYIFSIQFTIMLKYVSCTDRVYGHRPYVFYNTNIFDFYLFCIVVYL